MKETNHLTIKSKKAPPNHKFRVGTIEPKLLAICNVLLQYQGAFLLISSDYVVRMGALLFQYFDRTQLTLGRLI